MPCSISTFPRFSPGPSMLAHSLSQELSHKGQFCVALPPMPIPRFPRDAGPYIFGPPNADHESCCHLSHLLNWNLTKEQLWNPPPKPSPRLSPRSTPNPARNSAPGSVAPCPTTSATGSPNTAISAQASPCATNTP